MENKKEYDIDDEIIKVYLQVYVDAMEAKKLADEAVKEEMKALGYSYNNSEYEWSPFSGWRRLL